MTYAAEDDAPPFLRGGGITGQAIRAFDWSNSPIGRPETWPSEWKTAVDLMLGATQPVYVALGPDLISLYNDGYLPIVGSKHPGGLGLPFRTLWAEIWESSRPIVEATLAGKSQHFEDAEFALEGRPGTPVGYFTFSWTALRNDEGRATGMYCTSVETTARIMTDRLRHEAETRLDLALSAGNGIGSWDWDVVNDRVIADRRFALLYGVDPERAAAGAPIAEFFAGIHPDDLPGVQATIEHSIAMAQPFAAEYRLMTANGGFRWVAAQGAPIFDGRGQCTRFPGVTFDIHERRMTQSALELAKDTRDFVFRLMAAQRSADSVDEVLDTAVNALGEWLGADRCLFVRQLRSDLLQYGPCWTSGALDCAEGELGEQRFGGFLGIARQDGLQVVIDDTASADGVALDALSSEGVGAVVFMPIRRAGVPVGGMIVQNVEARQWTAPEVDLVREVCDLTVLAAERIEALDRLRDRIDLQADEIRSRAELNLLMERELTQLQKMEAVGQLASGIAHDFNNMLTVVSSGLNLIRRGLEDGETNLDDELAATMDGVDRAVSLTRRLLDFSRQAEPSPEPIEASKLVLSLTDLLRRTLGAGVKLVTQLADDLWLTTANRNQLENIVLNLAVNGRDAMPNGGEITITTRNIQVAEGEHPQVAAGQYVLLAVHDDGTGMTPVVLAKAFDPFFTTKAPGKGTGLGLSQAFRYLKQIGGHATIATELGQGTGVSLFLPRQVPDRAD